MTVELTGLCSIFLTIGNISGSDVSIMNLLTLDRFWTTFLSLSVVGGYVDSVHLV